MTNREQRLELVLQNFVTLTWWAEAGASIVMRNDKRSGMEVRELINLRSAAVRALGPEPEPKMPRCPICHRSDRVIPSPVASLRNAGVVRCLRSGSERKP